MGAAMGRRAGDVDSVEAELEHVIASATAAGPEAAGASSSTAGASDARFVHRQRENILTEAEDVARAAREVTRLGGRKFAKCMAGTGAKPPLPSRKSAPRRCARCARDTREMCAR